MIGGVYQKRVHGSRHLWRKGPAWAWDIAALSEAQRMGAKSVAVHDEDTGTVYLASMETVQQKGYEQDLKCGLQRFLNLRYFQVIPAHDNSQPPDDPGNGSPSATARMREVCRVAAS